MLPHEIVATLKHVCRGRYLGVMDVRPDDLVRGVRPPRLLESLSKFVANELSSAVFQTSDCQHVLRERLKHYYVFCAGGWSVGRLHYPLLKAQVK